MTWHVSRRPLVCAAVLLSGLTACCLREARRPAALTANYFQQQGNELNRILRDEAKKTIPALPQDTVIIGYLDNSHGQKNITYFPSELHIPKGQTVPVVWLSWDGSFKLVFRPTADAKKSPLVEGDTVQSQSGGGDLNYATGHVRFDDSAVSGTRYHFKVYLTLPGGEPLKDEECPPIIVD